MTQKAKSRQEIAQEYGVSAKTLSRWILKEKLQIAQGLISPKDQELIYEKFGKAIRK
jgi:transposase-like protein